MIVARRKSGSGNLLHLMRLAVDKDTSGWMVILATEHMIFTSWFVATALIELSAMFLNQPMEKCSKGALRLYYATFKVIYVKMVLISEFYMYRKQQCSYFERTVSRVPHSSFRSIYRSGITRKRFSIKFWSRNAGKNLRDDTLHISNVTVPRVPNPPIHNILIRHYEQWIQHQISTQKGNFDAEKIFRDSGIHISNVTVTQRSKLTNSQYIAPVTPGMNSASNFNPGRRVSRRKKFRNNGIHI